MICSRQPSSSTKHTVTDLRVSTQEVPWMTKRFNRNRSVVPGERVEDDDGHAAVIPAGGLGLVVALHGDVVVEGARRQPHQPATKRARSRGGQVRLRLGLRERSRVGAHRLKGSMEAMVADGETGASGFGLRVQGIGGRRAGRVPDRAGRRPPAAAGWIEAMVGRAMERDEGVGVHRFGIRPGNNKLRS